MTSVAHTRFIQVGERRRKEVRLDQQEAAELLKAQKAQKLEVWFDQQFPYAQQCLEQEGDDFGKIIPKKFKIKILKSSS